MFVAGGASVFATFLAAVLPALIAVSSLSASRLFDRAQASASSVYFHYSFIFEPHKTTAKWWDATVLIFEPA
jgi:hypothetical protein